MSVKEKVLQLFLFYKFWYDVPKMMSFLRIPKKLEMIQIDYPNKMV